MKVVSLSHSITFNVKDISYFNEYGTGSNIVQGKGGIPKSKWKLGTKGIRNDLWKVNVLLKNYKEFHKIPGVIVAFGNALQRNLGEVPVHDWNLKKFDASSAVCKQFDLPQIQLNDLTGETVWSSDCEVEMGSTYIFSVKITLVYNEPVPNLSKMQSDFSSLLKHGHHSDFLLVTEGKEFHVHKSILSTRSAVFQAMLSHDMRETLENKVDITDVRSEVLEKMLMFIYSGNLDNYENIEFLNELFMAADKYGISDLKSEIGEKLRYGISAENVSKRMVFAEQFEELAFLKQKCVAFICDNRDDLCNNTPPKKKKKVNDM